MVVGGTSEVSAGLGLVTRQGLRRQSNRENTNLAISLLLQLLRQRYSHQVVTRYFFVATVQREGCCELLGYFLLWTCMRRVCYHSYVVDFPFDLSCELTCLSQVSELSLP